MDFTPNINYSYNNEYIFGIPFNKSYQILFRTTRTINGKTEDVWANTQKQYANGETLPKFIHLANASFGVMKPNKEILYNISNINDMTVPKKNYTHFIIKGKAITNGDYHTLSTPKQDSRWSQFEIKHLRHNQNIQQSLPHTMYRLQNTVGESGRSLWSQLRNYAHRSIRDITTRETPCKIVHQSLSRNRYNNNFKLPRTAKTIMFETLTWETSARRGRRNVLGTPRVRGQSVISAIFDYPISNSERYALDWRQLRLATV